MSENDTLVNFSVSEMIQECILNKIDLVGLVDEINSADHAICHANSTQWYPSFGRSFFPFICASGRLIDSLYADRIRIKNLTTDESKWPYCESYVASHTLSNPDFKICNLESFSNIDKYTYMRHKYIHDGSLYIKNSIANPVVGKDFYKRNLQVQSVEDVFLPTSDLRSGLDFLYKEKDISFFPFIEEKIKELKNVETLYRFYNLAFESGWIKVIPEVNKAYLCKANQSSTCNFSTFQDTREDAALLVDGVISTETKSHTAIEINPWVEVELNNVCEVRSVIIYVRPMNFHVFRDFHISFSDDGQNYEIMYRKSDGCVPDSSDLKPIIINFGRENFAKFIRVTLLGKESLALSQIEVYDY